MGREEESGLVQNTSSPDREAERTYEKPYYVNYPNRMKVQRYCFVNVRPKNQLDAKSIVQSSAAMLIEKMDQRLHQISESLREKAVIKLKTKNDYFLVC